MGSGTLRTIFELALVIPEECTSSIFNRATCADDQPQVLDEFSKAIGNIVNLGVSVHILNGNG